MSESRGHSSEPPFSQSHMLRLHWGGSNAFYEITSHRLRKYFQITYIIKDLYLRIYQEPSKHNNKKTTQLFKRLAKDLNSHLDTKDL